MKRRSLLIVLSMLSIVVLGAWYALSPVNNEKPAENSRKELQIGYFSRAIGYAPYFVAQEKGWFEEHPALADWHVSHTTFGDRATIADSFDSGDLQVLMSAEIPAMMCRAQGNDIRIVDVTGLITLHWLAHADIHATGIESLVGKRVAFQSGTSSHYGLLTTIEQAGHSESDFGLQSMTAVEAKTAFEAGAIDAWVIWSPFFEQQIVSGAGTQVPGTRYSYATTLTVVQDLTTEHPEVVKALVEVLDRAKAWIPENRAEAELIVAEATGQSVEVAREALGNVDFSARLTTDTVEMFQRMAEFLGENNATRQGIVVDIRKEMLVRGVEILPGSNKQ